MATDFVLFIHGVNTRLSPENPSYAQGLMQLLTQFDAPTAPPLVMKELDWFKVMQEAETLLLDWLDESAHWQRSWFQDFRRKQIIPFTGDAALYISRYIGSEVVTLLRKQAEEILRACDPARDRLHLVAHSWGTVILFDILFAGRWDNSDIPGYDDAQIIRRAIFGLGVGNEKKQGIRIASIHTMGSPIALANLINLKRIEIDPGQELTQRKIQTVFTHDITFGLEQLLTELYNNQQRPLLWRNFAHVGDPVAYPLATIIPKLINPDASNEKYLDIRDISTRGSGWLEWIAIIFRRTFLALINGGSAHGSYWKSKQVAQIIIQSIRGSTSLKKN
jgi:hypothetical protein